MSIHTTHVFKCDALQRCCLLMRPASDEHPCTCESLDSIDYWAVQVQQM